MKAITRRDLLRSLSTLCLGMAGGVVVSACRERIVEVPRIIQVQKEVTKEVTKIVTEIVRETAPAAAYPPPLPEAVEKAASAYPAPDPRVIVSADVMNYGWTLFGEQMSPAFEEMFPQIEIRWQSRTDWRDYPQRIATLHAAGQLGDLVEGPVGTLLSEWSQRGIVRPLDEIITADGFDASGIFQGVKDACRVDGAQIGLPFIGHGGENVLLYNKRAFGDAGIELPKAQWSLEQLREAGVKLAEDRNGDGQVDRFAYAVRAQLPSAYPMLHLFDGHLLSQDGRECTIDGEGGRACLQWAYDQIYKEHVAPPPAYLERGEIDMLLKGRLVALRHGFQTLVGLSRTDGYSEEIGGVVFPSHPQTGKRGTLAVGMAYCITQRSENPQSAFQWIKFMSGREMGVQMFLNGYAEPGCRPASWADARILERYPLCTQLAESADKAEAARLPWNLRTQECLDAWNQVLPSLLDGQRSPADCATLIAEMVNQVLDRPPE